MVNLYQILGVSADADAATIAFAISECRLQGDINAQVLDKAEEWLLQAEVRAKYDAQLKQEDAAFFSQTSQTSTPTDTLQSSQASTAPVFESGNVASAASNNTERVHTPQNHAQTERPKFKTAQAKTNSKQRINIKRDGKKSNSRGCLVAFLIVSVLGVILLGVISWWGYTLFQDVKKTFNNFEIENMQTTPGWHVEDRRHVVYAVAQNQPTMVLMLVGENAVPTLSNSNLNQTVLCHRDENFLCQIQIQFDNDPPRTFGSTQIGNQIMVSDEADRAEMVLRVQDAEKLSIKLVQNPAAPEYEFVLGAFPSNTMVREASVAQEFDAEMQKLDDEVRKMEAEVERAKQEAEKASKQAVSSAQ